MVNRFKEMEQEYMGKNSTRHFGKTYLLTNPIYPKNIRVTLSEQNRPPPEHLSKLENSNTNLNLNITYYFLNILASTGVMTRFTKSGPITKTMKYLGLTKYHQKTVERTWHMVNWCQ